MLAHDILDMPAVVILYPVHLVDVLWMSYIELFKTVKNEAYRLCLYDSRSLIDIDSESLIVDTSLSFIL